ncbi:MAG: L-threonylcarbamoyladenylate synthase [Treponema sp.]|nr:L-threonylcarbamoyladenylate synthase [Treponema sp.]
MIEYIVPGNIDDRVLVKAVNLMQDGGAIAIPTDTSWSVVCSMNSKTGIKKLKNISQEKDERHFTLLCSDISQFGDICSLDNTRFRLIKRLTPGPYVFILKTLLGTEKALGLKRSEIGVRLPDYPVPLALINTLGCPLYGITAKRSMLDDDYFSPDDDDFATYFREETLFDGGWEMEDIRGLDMVLDPGEDRNRILSTVLDISSGDIQVLRQGAGPWPV